MSKDSLYTPFRSIGYVCDSNPFALNRLGEELFLTVSVGNCFQVYRVGHKLAVSYINSSINRIHQALELISKVCLVAKPFHPPKVNGEKTAKILKISALQVTYLQQCSSS